jgi:hypothetical protein
MEIEEIEEFDVEQIEHTTCLNCSKNITLVNGNPAVCPNCLWVNVILPKGLFNDLIKEKDTLEGITFDPVDYHYEKKGNNINHYVFPIFLQKDLENLRLQANSTAKALEKFLKNGKTELTPNAWSRLRQFKDKMTEQELINKINYYKARLKAQKFLQKGNFIRRNYTKRKENEGKIKD